MSDAISDSRRQLLARIIEALENGGCITDAILDYIDAALFSPEPERLAAFLNVDTDSERDSLLDLVFFPDQAFQIILEPLLEAARCSVEDKNEVHVRLMAREIHGRVNLPDGRKLVSLRVPDFIKSQYLDRLNISWQIDPQLATVIETCLSPALGTIVKVRLRNAGICTRSGRGVFLCRFFERMADGDPDFLACLDLALSMLLTADEGVDIYDLLIGYKRLLLRSLQHARRFETLLGRSNMETLMLQGVRAPHAPPDTLMQQMRLIDLMCLRIFGKTESMHLPMEEPVRQVPDMHTAGAAILSLLD